MANRPDGAAPNHARTGIAHDRLDPRTHFGRVAMHRAFVADRLPFPERTLGNPFLSIRQKPGTIFTQMLFSAVVSAAIHADHDDNGPDLKIHESDTIERSAPFQD